MLGDAGASWDEGTEGKQPFLFALLPHPHPFLPLIPATPQRHIPQQNTLSFFSWLRQAGLRCSRTNPAPLRPPSLFAPSRLGLLMAMGRLRPPRSLRSSRQAGSDVAFPAAGAGERGASRRRDGLFPKR